MYNSSGFRVIGFISNSFGALAPGSSACEAEYFYQHIGLPSSVGADLFPVFDHVEINGPNEHPLYTFLKAKTEFVPPQTFRGYGIEWNWARFYVDDKGQPKMRYTPFPGPDGFDEEEILIRKLLGLK